MPSTSTQGTATGTARTVADVTLPNSLAAVFGEPGAVEHLAGEVTTALEEVSRQIGVAAPVTTAITVAPGDVPTLATRLALRVNGTPCPYPLSMPSTVARAMDGRTELAEWRVEGDGWPRDWPADRLATLVARIAAEALRHRPSVLLTRAWVEELVQTLDAMPDEFRAVASFTHILATAVDLGMSIGDPAELSALLEQVEGIGLAQARELVVDGLASRTVGVRVPDEIVAALGTADATNPDDLLAYLATSLLEETGIVFPPVEVEAAGTTDATTFAIRVNDVWSGPQPLLGAGECLVNAPPDMIAAIVPEARPTTMPTEMPGAIAPLERRAALDAKGYTTWGRPDYVVLCLALTMRARAGSFVHQGRVLAQLEALESTWAVRAARAQLQLGDLTMLLRRLAAEGVPLRQFSAVLERIVDLPAMQLGNDRYVVVDDPVDFASPLPQFATDDDLDVERFVRTGLRDQIAHKVGRGTGTVVAYLLDDELEQLAIRPQRTEADADRIVAAVMAEVSMLPSNASCPALLTTAAAWAAVRDLVRPVFPNMAVVSHTDLPPTVAVQPIARISLA